MDGQSCLSAAPIPASRKKSEKPYRFFTISGGSLNSNPGLRSDIIKYGGDKLTKQIEMYKFDLIGNKGATAKDTMDYHLTEADLDMLTKSLADKLA